MINFPNFKGPLNLIEFFEYFNMVKITINIEIYSHLNLTKMKSYIYSTIYQYQKVEKKYSSNMLKFISKQ